MKSRSIKLSVGSGGDDEIGCGVDACQRSGLVKHRPVCGGFSPEIGK